MKGANSKLIPPFSRIAMAFSPRAARSPGTHLAAITGAAAGKTLTLALLETANLAAPRLVASK